MPAMISISTIFALCPEPVPELAIPLLLAVALTVPALVELGPESDVAAKLVV